jgi:prepilin-type N-terminal cleavage/methylation domain-containing protein
MKNQKGFSLVELLVVVIIIAIVAAIAIPNLLASRRAANEASAISSLRTIHSAEASYQATTGQNTGYATLAALGTGGLIDGTLSAGTKSGYAFVLDAATSQVYCATAKASTKGTTGVRSFAVNQTGVIQAAADATIACTAVTGAISNGTAIQ